MIQNQRLKPFLFGVIAVRLKARPDTNPRD
jgi:hypothetical protein